MDPLTQRIERALTLLFSEFQQSTAARHLKIAHPLLSRTLSGNRAPSRTLINAMESLPQVNARWLHEGVGEPLLTGETTLPVVSKLPPNAKTPWNEVASAQESFRISENAFSESRYWWKLSAPTLRSWGSLGRKATRVEVGDYLLLETDSRQMAALTGQPRLAITAHPAIEGGKPCWGRLANERQFISFKEAEKHRIENERKAKTPKKKLPRRRLRIEETTPKHKQVNETVPAPEMRLPSKTPQMRLPTKTPQMTTIETEHLMAIAIEMTSTSIFRMD
jgi:hypothetical protein